MFFAAPTERHAALARVPELQDLAQKGEDALTADLASRFAKEKITHWADRFAGTSVGIVPLGSLHGTREDGLQLESAGGVDIKRATYRAVRHDTHPMGRWVDLAAPNAVRPAHAEITIPGPAPKYGAQSRSILARLGYSERDIEGMIAQGIAAEAWSEKYLPE